MLLAGCLLVHGLSLAQDAEPRPPASPLPAIPDDPRATAWDILSTAAKSDDASSRGRCARALAFLPSNGRARETMEKLLSDQNAGVRVAAASSLGEALSRNSIPKLRQALSDDDAAVVIAAAHSLAVMGDSAGFAIYYEVLSGQRKSGGLIHSQVAILKDPKKLAELGFEQGIGFVPFAGMGWQAIKIIAKDDASPVRAAAARMLARDHDEESRKALAEAVTHDRHWPVRLAAAEAIALRGDPRLLQAAEFALSDDKEEVKLTAAAAILRLLDLRDGAKRKPAAHPRPPAKSR